MKKTPVRAIDHYWTIQEWGVDRRTGTLALLAEREEDVENPRWDWRIGEVAEDGKELLAKGTSRNQTAARLAVERFIRKLPDKET